MKSNCYKCGKFVGADGNYDISYDYYGGGYEQGYPECRSCINKSTEKYNNTKLEQVFTLFNLWA